MDTTPLRLVSRDRLFGNNVPFPFCDRRQLKEEDDRLFGDRKSGFKFEKMAEEFENQRPEVDEDSGIDSEVSSTISPGSVTSLCSPELPSGVKPVSLVVRDMNVPPPAKHWKKSLTRNFLNEEHSSTAVRAPGLSVLSKSRNLPVPVAPTRPLSKPRIVQPWATTEGIKPETLRNATNLPAYSPPSSFLPSAWSSPLLPSPPPSSSLRGLTSPSILPPPYPSQPQQFYHNTIFQSEPK